MNKPFNHNEPWDTKPNSVDAIALRLAEEGVITDEDGAILTQRTVEAFKTKRAEMNGRRDYRKIVPSKLDLGLSVFSLQNLSFFFQRTPEDVRKRLRALMHNGDIPDPMKKGEVHDWENPGWTDDEGSQVVVAYHRD
jgi:hypothetical protein